jgi:TIR domain
MVSRVEVPALDLAPPKPWRRFVPLWLRSLVWVDFASRYDVFLSYSWKSDRKVAETIQFVLQRFLCPWYKLRAKTVFRDLSCLPAGPNLENELFDRLDRSTHLIVLASPEAVNSRGMEIEARHWFSRPRAGEVIVIITSGGAEIWEDIRERLLPPSVRSNLISASVWASLRQRRDRILANPKDHWLHGQLIEDLNQVLLRLYPDRDWGQLRGEERAQRRRALWLLSAAAVLFLVLALAAGWFGWDAQKQRVAAEERLAQIYWQNSRSARAMGQDPEALHFAAEAIRLAPSLRDLVLSDIRDIQPFSLRQMLAHQDKVNGPIFSRDESRILSWSDDNTARLSRLAAVCSSFASTAFQCFLPISAFPRQNHGK